MTDPSEFCFSLMFLVSSFVKGEVIEQPCSSQNKFLIPQGGLAAVLLSEHWLILTLSFFFLSFFVVFPPLLLQVDFVKILYVDECVFLSQRRYRCPICSKSTLDMSSDWEKLDEEVRVNNINFSFLPRIANLYTGCSSCPEIICVICLVGILSEVRIHI